MNAGLPAPSHTSTIGLDPIGGCMGAVLRPASRGEDWQQAVHEAIEAYSGVLACTARQVPGHAAGTAILHSHRLVEHGDAACLIKATADMATRAVFPGTGHGGFR